MSCKCGQPDCKSSGTGCVPRSYDQMQVVMYGVMLPGSWPNPWTPTTPDNPIKWVPDTETSQEVTIPGLSPRDPVICKDCTVVSVLKSLVEMLLKRIDKLEAELAQKSRGCQKSSKCRK